MSTPVTNKAAVRSFARQDAMRMTAASTAYSPKLRTLSVAGMVVARWTGRGLEITKFGWSTPTTRDRVRYLLQLLRIESTPEELASDRTYRVLQVPA